MSAAGEARPPGAASPDPAPASASAPAPAPAPASSSASASASSGSAEQPPRRRRSLLGKVVVAISTVIVVFAVAAMVPLVRLYRQELIDSRSENLDLLTEVLIQRSFAEAYHERSDILEVVERNASALAQRLGGAGVQVVDHRGLAISIDEAALFEPAGGRAAHATAMADAIVRERGGLGALTGPEHRVDRDGDHLVHVTPIRSQTQFLEGALIIDLSLAEVDRDVLGYLMLRLALLPVLLLVTGVATIAVLYRHVLRPLGALTRANAALVRGDLEAALVPPDAVPDDELGEVIRARNDIYARTLDYQAAIRRKNKVLEEQQSELERWAEALEARVLEKTGELERAQEHLLASEKLAATGSLAAGLAHEINNPLASIAGYAEDLLQLAERKELRSLEAFAEFPESLKVIQEQAFRCNRIIRQLMTFARPQPYRPEALDLAEVVEGVLPLVEHKARGREVAVIADLDPDVGSALGDRARLEQVLVNLLVNAFDVIEGHRGQITLITRRLSREEVAIDVRDTGPGIPEEIRRRIFDPFFTTKPVGQGTGLGLSICQALVTRMGGRIEVSSELRRGSTFRVVLPAAAARSA